MSTHHDHHHDGPEIQETDLRGLSRRELLRRSGLATGGMLLAAGATGFAPVPTGALRGPAGLTAASRTSKLAASTGTRLVHADMHNHTLLSDGDGRAAEAFGLMQERGLDVAALTDHATGDAAQPGDPGACDEEPHDCGSALGLNRASWQYSAELAEAANDPANGFIAIRGFEWSATVQGHINVWFSEEFTDPTLTAGQAGVEGVPGFLGDEAPGFFEDSPVPVPQELADVVTQAGGDGAAIMRNSPAPGMAGFYRWLQSEPSTTAWGGGRDGIAGFNHPGREAGRFGAFGHLAGANDRMVSIEVMNRSEDYLFKGVQYGDQSPIVTALNEGWRLGLLGVTDEHGDRAWGRQVSETKKGRGGLWIREDLPYNRTAVKEAMTARRFFATNKSGLRLDLRAQSLTSTESVRMGQTLAHESGVVVFQLDIDGILGEDWAGSKPLQLQVLRPSESSMPTVALEQSFVVPAPTAGPVTFAVDLDVADGDWVFVRVSDPSEGFEGERRALRNPEAATFEPWGRAVAYSSPVFLDPGADASAEAMRREVIAGVR